MMREEVELPKRTAQSTHAKFLDPDSPIISPYPLVNGFPFEDEIEDDAAENPQLVIQLVLLVNVTLLVLKVVAAIKSGALSVISVLLDSFLDLLSQFILWIVQRDANRHDYIRFPQGKTRLEPIGVIVVSVIMSMIAFFVFLESIQILITGLLGNQPVITWSIWIVIAMLAAVILKLGIWVIWQKSEHPVVKTMVEDSFNDILNNSIALITSAVATNMSKLWYLDCSGAFLISLFIMYSWYDSAKEQTHLLMGIGASPDQLDQVRDIVDEQDAMELDILRAYHFGRNILVELECIMEERTTLKQVHDASLALQQNVEKLRFVERCFVHVDYEPRQYDEHKPAKLM